MFLLPNGTKMPHEDTIVVESSLGAGIIQLRGRVDELERANAELMKKIKVLEAECQLASEWRQISIERFTNR